MSTALPAQFLRPLGPGKGVLPLSLARILPGLHLGPGQRPASPPPRGTGPTPGCLHLGLWFPIFQNTEGAYQTANSYTATYLGLTPHSLGYRNQLKHQFRCKLRNGWEGSSEGLRESHSGACECPHARLQETVLAWNASPGGPSSLFV